MSAELPPVWRFPLLVLGFVALAMGVGAGLARVGWSVPDAVAGAAALHGPLMVSGFFGTVIGLERAVALRRLWAYLGPLCSGLGGLALILGVPGGPALLAAGSFVLLAGSVRVFLRQRALFTLTLALGAGCWLVGNLIWLGGAQPFVAVPWWTAFLVLTIAGERLELSRLMPPSAAASRVFGLIVALMLGALALSLAYAALGTALFAGTLLAAAAWLLRQDIARRTVRQRGLTRFIAVCLLSGYAWLAVGALIALASGGIVPGSASYDAALHAVLLGFVFSMVFGHAPIVFPAVLRVQIPYHPVFYLPPIVLHASLALRLGADLFGSSPARAAGALLNALALLLFILGTIGAVVCGRVGARRGLRIED